MIILVILIDEAIPVTEMREINGERCSSECKTRMKKHRE
jgi:hypothetical protein